MAVVIDGVADGSVAFKKRINSGDVLVSINGHEILDFLDYQFYLSEEKLRLLIKSDGVYRYLTVKKGQMEDIGLVFNDYLMDKQHHCKNKCIFCFIDQLPKGLRKTLYFKDDDSRLSFLFGNYITLTNLTQRDVERIIEMHISPVNISVHTTNPDLRVKMMKNKNAGESLKIIKQLADAGIKINTQLVLCPGINDGDELKRTLNDLKELYPQVQMVAAVPLGVTKFREGLPQLDQYNQQTAAEVLDIIEGFAADFYEKHGVHFAFAADEFYLKAKREIPQAEYYEDFEQLENGVGMCALLKDEFLTELANINNLNVNRKVTIATGVAAFDLISSLCRSLCEKINNLQVNVVPVKNEFFGETITVTGLIVGKDLISQLSDKELGDELIISSSMLRSEGDLFLDDTSLQDVENELKIPVRCVANNGAELLHAILGDE